MADELDELPDGFREAEKETWGGGQNNFKKKSVSGQIKQFISNVRQRTDSEKLFQ
jgi:hypothetical protein